MRRKALDRTSREETVLLTLAATNEWMTVADIARSLDLSPSTHLRNIVRGLVAADIVFENAEDVGVGCIRTVYTYRLMDQSYLSPTLPTIPRTIRLNGVEVEV